MALQLGIGLGLIPTAARPSATTAPVSVVKPSFDGILTQGQSAEVNPGAWTGLPSPNFAVEIKRGDTMVSTDPDYVWTSADVAAGAGAMTVAVAATNEIGSTIATSDPVTIAAPLQLAGTPMPGHVGALYNFAPTRTGGHAPFVFALTGTLPAGITFSTSTGAITGTPVASGTAALSVGVTDADGLTASLAEFELVVSTGTPRMAPSAAWNGTEGSGFGGSHAAEPTVTTTYRTVLDTARGIGGYFNGDREAFIADYRLHVVAHAGAAASVKFYLEGATEVVDAPTPSVFVGGDGLTRTAWTYSVDMDWSACAIDGWIKWFAEIIPNDRSMDSRVLPAQLVKRRTGSLHDATLTFGPGGTYASLTQAILAAGASTNEHIQLTCSASHAWDPIAATPSFTVARYKKGIIDISPQAGATLSVSTNIEGNSPFMRLKQEGLRWNSGIVFDARWLSVVSYPEPDHRKQWFNGCEIMSSGGQNELPGSIMRSTAGNPRTNYMMPVGGIMTEVYYHDTYRGPVYQQLTRFCTIKNISEDTLSVSTGLPWSVTYGNTSEHNTSSGLRNNIDAISVVYSGAASTATVSTTGTLDGNTRKLVLREDGVIVRQSAISTTWGSGIYSMQDLVNDTNLQAGWGATLLDDTRRAASIGGVPGVNIVNAKGVAATIGAGLDVHSDTVQLAASGHTENVLVINNLAWDLDQNQFLFPSAATVGASVCDVAFINNAGAFPVLSGSNSQWAGVQSHVLTWHNDVINQNVQLRGDFRYAPDASCSFYGNVMQSAAWQGTVSDAVSFTHNHLISGSAPAGAGVADNTTGGSAGALVPGGVTGDFAPAGALLADLIIPKVPYDALGRRRNAESAKGAVEVA